jgi:DNA-binding transcriptional regulator YdaS (Cro superfamily)
MTLSEFLLTLSPDERRAFRRQVLAVAQVRPAAWHQWTSQRTFPSPRNTQILCSLSQGRLTPQDLRPQDYEATDPHS